MPSPYFPTPPQRVVSLVPSITESLFDLGLGKAVVGITDYCIHPAEKLTGLPRLGGTKNPRVAEILALEPELVIANQEENTPQTIHALEQAGITVWLTFPKTVDEALADLRDLADIFQHNHALIAVNTLEHAIEFARMAAADQPPLRYFCPIWMDKSGPTPWWMTFNRETYTSSLLSVFGAENVFAERTRRYPLEADLKNEAGETPEGRDTRYPRVTLPEILAANPEIILLPDEPFRFDESHAGAFEGNLIRPLDGSLLTWHGTRMGKALQVLPALLER